MDPVNGTRDAGDAMQVKQRLEKMPQPDYGERFLTLTSSECNVADAIHAPVHDSLLKLKKTTFESLPQYKSQVKARNHAQVLKTRLSNIAEHIQHVLHDAPEEARGAIELKLCRVIATRYWPLPVTTTTHLDIHRIYRNALFRLTSQEQFKSDEARHQVWVEQNQDKQRQRGSFRNARVDCYLRGEMEMANYNQFAEWEVEQEEEESKRVAAEVQEIGDALYDRERQESEDRELARKLQEDEDANELPYLISHDSQHFTTDPNGPPFDVEDLNNRLRQTRQDRILAQQMHDSQCRSGGRPRTRQSIIPQLIGYPQDATEMTENLAMSLEPPYFAMRGEQTASYLSTEHARYEDKKRKAKEDDGA